MFITVKFHSVLLAVLAAAVCLSIPVIRSLPASTDQKPLSLAIIMYHGLIDDASKQNQYMIDPQYFEEDLQYLNANGYHTIFVSELIAYFENGSPLPDKPVLLTFDDGYFNNYALAYPLLQKYRCKAVISPIGSAADKENGEAPQNTFYSQCTWQQLREMQDSGLVEVQNHTYDLHHIDNGRNGAKNKEGEDLESYRQMLRNDLTKCNTRMQEELGKVPQAVVFPFGSRSKETLAVVREMHFQAAMDCEEKINTLSSSEDLFYLHRFLRPNHLSSKSFFENTVKIDQSQEE